MYKSCYPLFWQCGLVLKGASSPGFVFQVPFGMWLCDLVDLLLWYLNFLLCKVEM